MLEELLHQVQIPKSNSKVYNEECVLTFQKVYDEGGIYIDFKKWFGFSEKFVHLNYTLTGQRIYLHLIKTKKIINNNNNNNKIETEPPKKRPTVLGIGVEGGFDDAISQPEYETKASIYVLPEQKAFDLTSDPSSSSSSSSDHSHSIPKLILDAAHAIIQATSHIKIQEVQSWQDGGPSQSLIASELKQLDNQIKIPRYGWRCCQCDKTENLWLNLTDGSINCGRRNWDGTGGNGHAQLHYEKTGYPIAVKLGTITPQGTADVWSYAEDDAVIDPLLEQHLNHFGIKLNETNKTEKTTAELQLELNLSLKFDDSRVTESGKSLIPIYGPGYTGIHNLGNTCYMASILQTLFSIPEFQTRYFSNFENFAKAAIENAPENLIFQIAKLAHGLLSGEKSNAPINFDDITNVATHNGIEPRMFKQLIAQNHSEFSSFRQQDALEYLQFLLTRIERAERAVDSGANDPTTIFSFTFQERFQCSQSSRVRYLTRKDNVLSIPIDLDAATNKQQVEIYEQQLKQLANDKEALSQLKIVRPEIPFRACLQSFIGQESISNFYSSAIHANTTAFKTTRILKFPQYLIVSLRRYYIADDWTPKKLNVFIDVPDVIDLEFLKAKGLQPDEQLLVDEPIPIPTQTQTQTQTPTPTSTNQITPQDESIITQIIEMGFSRNAAIRAIKTVGQDCANATEWIFQHIEDADINDPLPVPSNNNENKKDDNVKIDESAVEMLLSMGFLRPQVVKALKETNGDVQRATDWIFNHIDDLGDLNEDDKTTGKLEEQKQEQNQQQDQKQQEQRQQEQNQQADDNQSTRYKLFAFVTHIGSSIFSGHYVCHINKEGQWCLFNDAKVAISQDPPKEMGYLYFFKRLDF
eukprot:TRINITY_DN2361_c0_g2_i1.p1 TRINITY_DN2361_c0_g2~~TRINITY_DN2361_c0_g2_i1.p1  ORF type:complete len:865 (-),score=470.14 TRINITY_DN2361_c0_g2_i1:50-2644(-)